MGEPLEKKGKTGDGRKGASRLSLGIKIGYGTGDIAHNFFIVTTGMYLLLFLTDVVRVDPFIAGLALLFPKLWDVISDPMMGIISDKTKSPYGRRRVYLLYGAIPYGLAFFFLFIAPHYQSELSRAIHVSLLYALVCTAFTVVQVPYASMVPEMTDNYNERMSLTSFRMSFASIGALMAGGLALPLVKMGGEGEAGYRFMGAIFGIVITVMTLICFWATRNTKKMPLREVTYSIGRQVKIAFQNFPFFMLILSFFFQALAIGVMMAGFVYYVKCVMKLPETAMNIVLPLFLVTAILFIPVWVQVGKRLGKIRGYMVGLTFFCVMIASLYFTGASQLPIFYAQIFLMGIGFSSFQLFPYSMLPDTIEYDELKSGTRREGVFSGMWSAGQKTAYAISPFIVGAVLSYAGYVPEGMQPEQVEPFVRLVFCLFPAAVILLSFIPFARYELTEERFEQIKKQIAKKVKK